jgi:Flp pilus assembly protein TadG
MLKIIWKTQAIRARLLPLFRSFLANRRGNVAVITAVAALPVITAIGCVIDYSMASMIKTKLQAAADAATLAAVSFNSPVTTTAKSMTGNGAVPNGATYTQNFFDSNLASAPADSGYNSPTRTATVSKAGTTMTATLSYAAVVPTFFLGIIGYPNISIGGSSTSTYTLPAYLDFYLLLDVSGSMGMPSTNDEMTRLQAVKPTASSNIRAAARSPAISPARGHAPRSVRGRIPPWANRPIRRPVAIAKAISFRV